MNRYRTCILILLILFSDIGCQPVQQDQIVTAGSADIVPTATSSVSQLNLSSSVPPATLQSNLQNAKNLIFSDEFDGDYLNTDHWVTCYWWVTDGCTILSNNEMEWYQADNVSISNGKLILEARKQPIKGWKGKIFPYTSGMVSTGRNTDNMQVLPRFSFQYGYLEIRAKTPIGQGLWPAFWLLPVTQESRPEIDIMEILGQEPNTVKFNYHYIDSAGKEANIGGEWVAALGFSGEWHTFGLEWDPNQLVWFVDGVGRYKFTDVTAISAEPMYIILNLAVGGDWPGAPDSQTPFPSDYQIDYIKVWGRP